jgi:hypothetical protein
MRIITLVAGKSQPAQPQLRDLAAFLARHVEHIEPKLDISDRSPPRQQPIALEHDRDLAAQGIKRTERVIALHEDASLGRRAETGDHIENGGLAAAGLAQDRHQFARRDREAEIVDGTEGLGTVRAAEGLRHVVEHNFRRARLSAHMDRSEKAR